MKFLILILVLVQFYSKNVETTEMAFSPCTDRDDLMAVTKNCKISKVEVVGCRKEKNAASECKLRRNSENASVSIQFTPDFEGDNITMMAYTTVPVEAQWPGMDDDACKFMTCPVEKNALTTYSYGVKLDSSFPRGSFSVRFLMKQNGEPKCCFKTRVKIEK